MLLLAPMEGLLDHRLRDVLTQAGGFTRCVSEFIRITDQPLPARVFERTVPELQNRSRTRHGTPVRVQLLGSDPHWLAHHAAFVASLGAEGIDLNFGCPAPTVNRHRGGAVLLDDPALVHRIVAAVRRAVPAAVPVSAKMRLGYRDHARMLDNALAIEAAGADELVVHARTKVDGYRPPAYWGQVRLISEAVRLPLVANGEIWTVADARRCREESGCQALMLGRGQLADPGLAAQINGAAPLGWNSVLPMLAQYWALLDHGIAARHRAGRIKQWLNLLRRRYGPAQAAFDAIRLLHDPAEVEAVLFERPASCDEVNADAERDAVCASDPTPAEA